MMLTKPPRSRRYRRNLARVTALALLAGVISLAAGIVQMNLRAAQAALDPPRIPPQHTPRDVGIPAYEDVTFYASDGVALRGWYIPPQNGAVIILAHGYATNRSSLLTETRILVGAGYGAFLFEFRGHGESTDALVTLGDHEQRDLGAAVDFVAAQPGVERIGGLGFSMGAATLAQVAARDERLSAVVIEAAFPTLREEIRYRSRAFGFLSQAPTLWVAYRSGADVDAVRPIDALCAISPRPLLLIYGELDDAVPPGTAQRMAAAACNPAELWVIADVGHGGYPPQEYAARLVRFFDAWAVP